MSRRRWRVRTSAPAAADVADAVHRSRRDHGAAQAERYRGWFGLLLKRLADGPDALGTRPVGEHGAPRDLRSLHMQAVGATRGRHAAFFVVGTDGRIVVLRLLHDAMDPARHLAPPDDGDEDVAASPGA